MFFCNTTTHVFLQYFLVSFMVFNVLTYYHIFKNPFFKEFYYEFIALLNACIFMSLKKTKQILPIGTLSNYCRVNSIVLGGVNSCINPIYNGYHFYFNTKFLFFKEGELLPQIYSRIPNNYQLAFKWSCWYAWVEIFRKNKNFAIAFFVCSKAEFLFFKQN